MTIMANNNRLFFIPFGGGGGISPDDVYTKEEVNALIADFITNTVDDLTNYYLKSETYTQAEVNSLVGQITSFEVVATLPVSDIKTNVIYLVGPIGTGADKYDEYIYSNSTWVKIGETSIDLSDYVTTTALGTALADYTPTAQLSTVATSGNYNDLTNKPTNVSVFNNDAGYITQADVRNYKSFPSGWPTTGTMAQLIAAITADSTAVTGTSYLATVSYSDLPTGLLQAEIKVDILDTIDGIGKNIDFTLTSSSVSPYMWLYTSAYSAAGQWRSYVPAGTLSTVAYSGDYTDLANAPVLATVATSGSYDDLTNKPVLSTVATTGAYADLTGTPTLATVATSGSYNDLTDKPTIPVVPTLATVATTGDYTDLTNTPNLAAVATTGAYSDLTGAPTLATVATSGDYADLTGAPTISTVGITGNYSDLNGAPVLATVATSGSYNDLTDKPNIPVVPTLATVATSGSYNDLTDKLTAGSGISIGTDNVISATGGGTDNTFELSGEAQSDLADLYLELTTDGRSLGPTTIENWLMDNRVTYYGYPIVSAFVGDYTVDNNGNLAPISPRSRDTKAPVQVNDTKVVFGYYPDVRVSGQTVGMKYVLLQSDGTLVTAVDTITITSGGGKNVVEMSTDDQVTSQQEWADLYDAIDEDPDAWFEANTLVINGYECDRWEKACYMLDDNSQVIYDQDEQEAVYAFWCGFEMWNDAKVYNDTDNLSYVVYAVCLLHSDGAVDAGGDTLTLKPVVELLRIANGDNGYGEYIYNWIMDHTIDDFVTLNAVYYNGQPVNNYYTGKFTTDGDGHLVEDLSLQEDTAVFQLDTLAENGTVTTRYTLLFSDGTMEDADTVIDLTNSVTLNFTDSNNVTTSYTFYIHPSR